MREQGFTILELLVTLVIVSLLSFYASSHYQNFKDNILKEQLVFRLTHDLEFAKNLASITNRAISICGSKTGTKCNEKNDEKWLGWILFFDENSDFSPNGEEIILFHDPDTLTPFYIQSSINIGGGINIAPRRQYAYGMGRSLPNGRLTLCHIIPNKNQTTPEWIINVYGYFRTEIKKGSCR